MTNEATNNATSTQADPAAAATTTTDATATLVTETPAQVDPNADPTKATDAAAKDGTADNAEDKKPDDKKADETKLVAPEKYEDFVMPEGVEVQAETMTEFTTLAKKYNLPQEAAQELASLGAKIAAQAAGKPSEMVKLASEEWKQESIKNTEFGGAKLPENLAIAKKALDTFGSDGLKKLLDQSGLGNHPEVVGYFYRVGKNIGEDGMVTGGRGPSTPRAPEDVLYGKKN